MKTIICFMIMMCCSSVYAQLYIDPGHGGPGADQFHNGGDGSVFFITGSVQMLFLSVETDDL